MATSINNPLIHGLSGKLGQSFVFRQIGGKTIVAKQPARARMQSEQQKANRSRFKEATQFAKAAMLDATRKEYYMRKAKKLKLPNAYTAAITDYMRAPLLSLQSSNEKGVTVVVKKKGFALTKVAVMQRSDQGELKTVGEGRTADAHFWHVCMGVNELLMVEDNVGVTWIYDSTLRLTGCGKDGDFGNF